MFAAPIIALGFASFAAAAPVSSSSEAYVSTYISASEVWTSRFANATYTANATVTVAETTVTVTVTPTSTSSYVSSSASASASSSAVASSASSTSEWVAPSSSSSPTSEWAAPSSTSTSSTSEWVAPSSSSTSEWVAPSSSAVVYQAAAVETSSTYEAPAPAATSAAPSNSGDFHGTATYYYQNGNPGSCGNWNSDSVHIVAVNSAQQSGTCGRTVTITNDKTGTTMTALCADTCPTCSYGSLDLSSGLFAALGGGDMGQGTFPISWSFN